MEIVRSRIENCTILWSKTVVSVEKIEAVKSRQPERYARSKSKKMVFYYTKVY